MGACVSAAQLLTQWSCVERLRENSQNAEKLGSKHLTRNGWGAASLLAAGGDSDYVNAQNENGGSGGWGEVGTRSGTRGNVLGRSSRRCDVNALGLWVYGNAGTWERTEPETLMT